MRHGKCAPGSTQTCETHSFVRGRRLRLWARPAGVFRFTTAENPDQRLLHHALGTRTPTSREEIIIEPIKKTLSSLEPEFWPG